jgi:hypothetical protein
MLLLYSAFSVAISVYFVHMLVLSVVCRVMECQGCH